MPASVAARCVGEQGAVAYWAFHDMLMENQRAWSNNQYADTFELYVTQIGLDTELYNACLADNAYEAQIEEEMREANGRGVRSTPHFLVNNQPLVGAQPYSSFEQAISIVSGGGQFAEVEPTAAPRVAPDPVDINLENAAISYGDEDAPVTIVEFTDYQCPFCARHAFETLPAILNGMVADGRVRYVVMDYPIEQLHPFATEAAVAVRCAGEQDAYAEMHDALFATQSDWPNDAARLNNFFVETADALGLDAEAYGACLESGSFDEAIAENYNQGSALGVTGTPAFFINGYPVSGAQPYELFQYAVYLAEVDRLAEAYSDNPPPPPPALQQERPSGPVAVSEENAVVVGEPDAPITIVEFTDFQCSYCGRHVGQTFPLIQENYIDAGVVRYVFKDFPLETLHPEAVEAAQAARCANEQDAYLPMRALLFERQNAWRGQSDLAGIFTGFATELGLDDDAFLDCFESGRYETAVRANIQEADALGVVSPPTFFFNGFVVPGLQPYQFFEEAVRQLLEQDS